MPESLRLDQLLADLASIADERDRRDFIAGEPLLQNHAAMDELHAGVIRLAYRDMAEARRLEQAARSMAEQLNDDYCRALSMRCSGHLHYVGAHYESAVAAYESAVVLFDRIGLPAQSARTQSSAIQALSYLGRYDQALEWAASARLVFETSDDSLRIARLDSNVANMLLRQDRYDEALETYRRAYDVLAELGEPADLTAVLSNMGVCYMSMGQFGNAIGVFRRGRAVCEGAGFSKLLAEIDYNIAWLHYLRGEYRKATELYKSTREYCTQTGDSYHAALCDLDEAELLLDLNLSAESERLARRAAHQFARLGMRYERAKALVNFALAAVDMGRSRAPMLIFRKAWRLFKEDGNEVWAAVIDQYRAIVCHRDGRNAEAKRYCARAEAVLSGSPLIGKAVLCDLMRAQIYREAGRLRKARCIVLKAREHLQQVGIRSLALHASFLLAQLEEEGGHADAAYNACQSARQEIECLRTRLGGEDVQVSFLKDKLSLYEMLVRLCLRRADPASTEEAFQYMEEAKSRSLAEVLAVQAQGNIERDRHAEASEVQELRRKLQGVYRQIERASYQPHDGNRLRSLRGEANKYEQQLAQSVSALGRNDRNSAALLGGGSISIDEIRASIPHDATLLQYYSAGETLYCAILNKNQFTIQPLTDTSGLFDELRLFRFQMSKARLGPAFLRAQQDVWRRVTRSHLSNLYERLVSPIRHLLRCQHLIIAPHGPLHHLPFHALRSVDRYLVDDFTISYSPSASIFGLCSDRPPSHSKESLVFGIPDAQTPEISNEVREIAKIVPQSRLFLGAQASTKTLAEYGCKARIIHLATHGLFRRDNPLFSAIQLGDSRVSLLDLYDFHMPADLITLSGCSTGMNEVVGGDELIGLVRGLLYAGARSLLVSLWEVHDESTACFMKNFYAAFVNGANKAASLRAAMLKTREAFPHPYHWAPFVLVGCYSN